MPLRKDLEQAVQSTMTCERTRMICRKVACRFFQKRVTLLFMTVIGSGR